MSCSLLRSDFLVESVGIGARNTWYPHTIAIRTAHESVSPQFRRNNTWKQRLSQFYGIFSSVSSFCSVRAPVRRNTTLIAGNAKKKAQVNKFP